MLFFHFEAVKKVTRNKYRFDFINFLSDKLVLASSGEEVLFTDSDYEPELDIKVFQFYNSKLFGF